MRFETGPDTKPRCFPAAIATESSQGLLCGTKYMFASVARRSRNVGPFNMRSILVKGGKMAKPKSPICLLTER